MRIDSVELYRLNVPPSVASVLVAMRSEGTVGWGEAALADAPYNTPEWSTGAMQLLRDWLAPALVGREVRTGQQLQELLAEFRGNEHAKSALDAAWWDLFAREKGQPLHKALGGSRELVPLSCTLAAESSIDELLARFQEKLNERYAQLVLQLHPGWDLEVLRAVQLSFPGAAVAVDGRGSFPLDQRDQLLRMDDFMPVMVEQPLSAVDLVGHAMLAQSLRTQICLDESVCSAEVAQLACELEACRAVRIEPGRVGGLTPALAIAKACSDSGVQCAIGVRRQTEIANRTALALASLSAFTLPAETMADLSPPAAQLPALERGLNGEQVLCARWSDEPGIGLAPDDAWLQKFTVEHSTIR